MKASPNAINLIKTYEGLRLSAYICPAGKITIGYGHTKTLFGKTLKLGDIITAEQAEEILQKDLIKYENCIKEKIDVTLTQNQFDALVSLVYNIGCPQFAGSTLRAIVNGGLPANKQVTFKEMRGGIKKYVNHDAILTNIEYNFLRWCNSNGNGLLGLFKRRMDEYKLYNS